MPPLNQNSFDAKTIADFLEIWLTNDFLPETENKIFSHYYRSYKKRFNNYLKNNYNEQTKELLEIAAKIDRPKILEIGVGCGTEALWLALKGYDVSGVDIDDDLLSVARRRQELLETARGQKISCTFIKKSLLEMDATKKFDIIWLEQTLHHLEPRQPMLDQIVRLLKPNGYLIISEINAYNPLNQLRFFLFRGFKTVINYKGHLFGNERIIFPWRLKKEFKKRGLKTLSLRFFRILPNKRITEYLGFIDKLIPQFLSPLFTHYNYVGSKSEDK